MVVIIMVATTSLGDSSASAQRGEQDKPTFILTVDSPSHSALNNDGITVEVNDHKGSFEPSFESTPLKQKPTKKGVGDRAKDKDGFLPPLPPPSPAPSDLKMDIEVDEVIFHSPSCNKGGTVSQLNLPHPYSSSCRGHSDHHKGHHKGYCSHDYSNQDIPSMCTPHTEYIKVDKFDPSTSCWWTHPKVKSNWRVFLAAFGLLVAGTALIIMGMAVAIIPEVEFQSYVFFVAGTICFIPGAYHVVYVYFAVKGRKGYDFYQLPLFN